MAKYDKIAKSYADIEKLRPERYCFIDPSLMKAVGNIEGQKVMDLACGDGYVARKIKEKNPSEIVGIDISSEMIKLAKINPQNEGMKFYVGDAVNLKTIGEFDSIIAAFLLHYSKTKEELLKMCKNIYKNLKRGGQFVTINNNPACPIINDDKYGVIILGPEKLTNGCELTARLIHDKNNSVEFTFYYWKKEVYDWALKKAGFSNVRWIVPKVKKECKEKFEANYWNLLEDNNIYTIIKAIK